MTFNSELNLNNIVSVWEQPQYADPVVGRLASQDRKRQQSVAAGSIWKALYMTQFPHGFISRVIGCIILLEILH